MGPSRSSAALDAAIALTPRARAARRGAHRGQGFDRHRRYADRLWFHHLRRPSTGRRCRRGRCQPRRRRSRAGQVGDNRIRLAQSGPTTNPHNPAHTPAVRPADRRRLSPTVRRPRFRHPDGRLGDCPAAYCGVVGFKPTRGTYSTAGVKPLCLSGHGRIIRPRVADIVLFDGALRESAPPATALRLPRCGFIPYRDQLDAGGLP